MKECSDCEKMYIYNNKKKHDELCSICVTKVKIKSCELCPNRFILGINSNDKYCSSCDENLIKCNDCKRDILKNESNNLRCYKCDYRYKNNLILVKCMYCVDEFDINEKDKKWRKTCINCLKDQKVNIKCNLCNVEFQTLPHEIWRKTCLQCHNKNKK